MWVRAAERAKGSLRSSPYLTLLPKSQAAGPLLIEKLSRKHKRKVGASWRMDETYMKVKGVWKYLYRAVDKECKTVDFLLTAHRDIATRRFFDKAMREHGAPTKIAMDKNGADKTAIDEINSSTAVLIVVRQGKYLNNIIKQDHHAIKRVTKPMLGFKSFSAASNVLAGIDLMHMIRKGQFAIDVVASSIADQFYALAGTVRPV